MPELSPDELRFIAEAAKYLENPSFLVRVTDLVGKPLEAGVAMLPEKARSAVSVATNRALEKALGVSLATIPAGAPGSFERGLAARTPVMHTGAAALTGFFGGFFGLAGLAAELPVTTCVMLRSVAETAGAFGLDLADPGVRLECLMVFALGGPAKTDDEMESAYFTARVGMAQLLNEAASWVVRGGGERTAPALVRLIARVASRFEIVVSEKAVAEALPVFGALSGAAINAAFTAHFNAVARYHFGLRALENRYGLARVRELYEKSRR